MQASLASILIVLYDEQARAYLNFSQLQIFTRALDGLNVGSTEPSVLETNVFI